MIDELKAILDLLGDVTQIGGFVLAGWIIFKVIVLLSTTGAIVYCTKLVVESVIGHLTARTESAERIQTAPPPEKEVYLDNVVLGEGVYDELVMHIKQAKAYVDARSSVNREMSEMLNIHSSDYIHRDTVRFIGNAIEAAIQAANDEEKAKKA